MSNKEIVDRDIGEYLAKSDNLLHEGKRSYLRALFDKHFTFRKIPHTITRFDLINIVSIAKNNMSAQRVRPQLGGKPVDAGDLASLAIVEAFIGYCNRNGLLNKEVGLDYTSEGEEYEVLE